MANTGQYIPYITFQMINIVLFWTEETNRCTIFEVIVQVVLPWGESEEPIAPTLRSLKGGLQETLPLNSAHKKSLHEIVFEKWNDLVLLICVSKMMSVLIGSDLHWESSDFLPALSWIWFRSCALCKKYLWFLRVTFRNTQLPVYIRWKRADWKELRASVV